MKNILIYDQTFDGFLSAVFYAYEHKIRNVDIVKTSEFAPNFFDNSEKIVTDRMHAKRVWKSLKQKSNTKSLSLLYKAHLSELPESENLMFSFIQSILRNTINIENNYSDPVVLQLSKIKKMVDREKHRMDAFIRFKQTKDGMYFAVVAPDFNVLPLNAKHFYSRYADQKWVIYDEKRKYGIYYDLNEVKPIEITLDLHFNKESEQDKYFTQEEKDFENLWKNYFKSTNIKSRKNLKLHTRHVPKRYWRYLSEKSSL